MRISFRDDGYKVIMQKTFCIIHEIRVLGGNISAQYAKYRNWAESFLPNTSKTGIGRKVFRSIISYASSREIKLNNRYEK